jgi:hypothetical protein
VLALDMSRVPDIEYSALQALIEGERRATDRGAVVWLVGLNPGVLEVVRRSGLDERLGRERMLFNARAAIERYRTLHPGCGARSHRRKRPDKEIMSDDKGEAAIDAGGCAQSRRSRIEALFGLFMALTFVGAVSVTEGPEGQIRSMFAAALGCNLAWGLVDAVMYLIRTVTDRGRLLTLIRTCRPTPMRNPAAG